MLKNSNIAIVLSSLCSCKQVYNSLVAVVEVKME